MELLTITLAANETKQFAKAGRYFEIIDSAFAVTVSFYGANGAQSDSMVNALSGLFMEDAYSHFSISNGATGQTITLLLMELGRGGSRRQPGNVRVIDEITDAIQTLGFNPSLAVGAFTPTAVVAPATNVRGIVLRNANAAVKNGAGGTANLTFLACKSAPTGFQTPSQIYNIAGAYADAGVLATVSREMNKLLPAGWGIYGVTQVAAANAVTMVAQVTFEIL